MCFTCVAGLAYELRAFEKPSFVCRLQAARALGCRTLEEFAAGKAGAVAARARTWAFEEVRAANAAGRCLLILDGMVLDVTRHAHQ